MGTRYHLCIFYKGQFAVARYGGCDGHIEKQGVDILMFLLEPGNIERLKKGLEYISIVDETTLKSIKEDHKRDMDNDEGQEVCRCGAVTEDLMDCPNFPLSLQRVHSYNILEIIASAGENDFVPIYRDFEDIVCGGDWVYCYCIDLDGEVFEIFAGNESIDWNIGNIEPVGRHRFREICSLYPEACSVPSLEISFPFSQLPVDGHDLIRQLNEETGGDYEDIEPLEFLWRR